MTQSKGRRGIEDLFRPVTASRTSETVAEALRRAIVEGMFLPGDVLPPERALAERFRVTRNTVREAIRSLEHARLLSVRQGSGAHVRDYLSSAGIEFMTALLGSDTSDQHRLLRDLAEVRLVVGSAICAHAIDNFVEGELSPLGEAVEAFEAEARRSRPDVRALQELDFEIQSLIVRGGGNQALLLLHNTVSHVYRGIAHLFEPLVDDPRHVGSLYRKALTALEKGDAKGAKRAVTRLFTAGRDAMLAAYPATEGGDDHGKP